MTDTTTDNSLGVLWGADAIAAYINVDRRKCFYLLETQRIDADKIGKGNKTQWVTTKERLRRQFGTARVLPPAAADAEPPPRPVLRRRPSAFSKRGGLNMSTEQIDTCSKKGRGMAQKSLDLINAMFDITKAAQPITGRGVGYKLFTKSLIDSMETADMQRVYRLLKEARERNIIPWGWIVDETRERECLPSWDNPADFARSVGNQYRRDFWNQQPFRCEVFSEKGTVRGVLAPVLDEYGVGFTPLHGFSSATIVHNVADDDDGRKLIALYVGDWDPSGMYMSERDLPDRLKKYGGDHVKIKRIALVEKRLAGLPSFKASEKKDDPRYKWFVKNIGKKCWEIDALDPNVLRRCVEKEIKKLIELDAWRRCEVVNAAERDSLCEVLKRWGGKTPPLHFGFMAALLQ
jgi:hypothetical protein